MMASWSTSTSTPPPPIVPDVEVLHYPEDVRPPWLVHPVLALGNFDGLHRGHQKIIDRVKRGAAEHGGTPMAMTFDPHPPRIVRPDKAPPLLMTKAQRLEALHRAGIQCVAVVRFTKELSQWDPDTFVRMWEYYLCYCEGGFLERSIGDVQMLFVKPGARPPQYLPDLAR